jgi:hypothetical protein
LSAQGSDVFGATHGGNVAQDVSGLQDPAAIQLRGIIYLKRG